MALQGNLRDFSASEILQLLGTQKKTGCLTLERADQSALVYVLDGRVVSTRAPGLAKNDPLLAFLRGAHRLSDEQQRGILTIQRESARDLEDLLLNGRYLDAEELAGFVERQVLDQLMRLVRWEDGTYRFDPRMRWPHPPLVRLSIEGILMEVARRSDEQRRHATTFADPHLILGLRDLPDPNHDLGEDERELFGIIDGRRTLAEVVAAAPLSEYETLEALQRMVEAGWIEPIGRRAPGQAEPAQTAPAPAVRRVRWERELAIAAALVAVLLGLRLTARLVAPPSAPTARTDVFAAAQVRDLRMALDLYRREHGTYPATLQDLAAGDWLSADALRVGGREVGYRVRPDGQAYELAPDPVR